MSFPWRKCSQAAAGPLLLALIGCENPGKVEAPSPDTQVVVRTDTVLRKDTVYLSRADTLRITDTVFVQYCAGDAPVFGNPCIPEGSNPPRCTADGTMVMCRDGRWGYLVLTQLRCEKDAQGKYQPATMPHMGYIGIDRAEARPRPARMLRASLA
jgi:hypothetical protein